MEINVLSTKLSDFLKREEELYIPRFQRPYSWRKKQFEELWNDITTNEESHFIGTIIRYPVGKNKYYIVDGQQRLTTLSVLLAAIRDAYIDLGDVKGGKIDDYIKPDVTGSTESFYKINYENGEGGFNNNYRSIIDIPDSDSRAALPESQHISSGPSKNLMEAHKFFKLKISRMVSKGSLEGKKGSLLDLLKKVRALTLVDILMGDVSGAYRIFMTLNVRGVKLNQTDLIKSHILSHLSDSGNNDTYIEMWNKILDVLSTCPISGGIKEDDYFYNYLMSIGASDGIKISKKKTFEKYHNDIQDAETAYKYLKSLLEDVSTYRIVYEPTYNQASILRGDKTKRGVKNTNWIPPLEALQTFGVTQPNPLILATLRRLFDVGDRHYKQEKTQRLFSMIEDFHFIFTKVESVRGSKIENLYTRYANDTYKTSPRNGKQGGIQKIQDSLAKEFEEYLLKITSKESFVKKFPDVAKYDKSNDSNQKLLMYILRKYQPEFKELPDNPETIEHIMPQSEVNRLHKAVDEKIKDKNGNIVTGEWKQAEKERITRIINSPGNLIIVRKKTNEVDLKDKPFLEKQVILKKVRVSQDIPSEILEAKSWTLEDIVHRTEKMAERGYDEIWSFNKYK